MQGLYISGGRFCSYFLCWMVHINYIRAFEKMKTSKMHLKIFFSGLGLSVGILVSTISFANTGFIVVQSMPSSRQMILGSTVLPYKEVTLTAQLSGQVVTLAGDVGATFTKGFPLVKINDEVLVARRKMVEAELGAAKAVLRNAQIQYKREVVSPKSKDIAKLPGMGLPAVLDLYLTQRLADRMGTTDTSYNRYSDLMHSATNVNQAKSQFVQVWSRLNEINANLSNAISTAPFEGMILQKMVEIGDTVQLGQPLLTFGFINYLRLKAAVPSTVVGLLKHRMVVPVKINGRMSEARVTRIYPIADAVHHTVIVQFDLKIGLDVTPGMYAELFLPDARSDQHILVIPKTVLLKGRNLPSILVLDTKNKTTKLRIIRLGEERQDGNVEVVTGLQMGEQVVNNPPLTATSGWMPK